MGNSNVEIFCEYSKSKELSDIYYVDMPLNDRVSCLRRLIEYEVYL